MAICHHLCLSEEKANVQHFYQHIFIYYYARRKLNLKPALHLTEPEVPNTWATVRESPEEKLAGQVENISQKQNTSKETYLNKNFPRFSSQESWGKQSKKKGRRKTSLKWTESTLKSHCWPDCTYRRFSGCVKIIYFNRNFKNLDYLKNLQKYSSSSYYHVSLSSVHMGNLRTWRFFLLYAQICQITCCSIKWKFTLKAQASFWYGYYEQQIKVNNHATCKGV